MEVRWPRGKLVLLAGIILLYFVLGISFYVMVASGLVERAPSPQLGTSANVTAVSVGRKNLDSAIGFFSSKMLRGDGHIDLYYPVDASVQIDKWNYTSSEAVSYYLLWTATAKLKPEFDRELDFLEAKMLQPQYGYLMWQLSPDDQVINDGGNIASDADIRTLKALLLAEKQWGDNRYTLLIDKISGGLKAVALSRDGFIAPYGGPAGDNSTWASYEVWLSYGDNTVFSALASRYGEPWTGVYNNTRNAVLHAQLVNGLYNQQLTDRRLYGNGLDNGGYSINSMWIMVRNAESGDPALMASAKKALGFYKRRYGMDSNVIYASYGSSGDPVSPTDAPWAYALLGRTATELGDRAFADEMVQKLIGYQDTDPASPTYGAIIEDREHSPRSGQFTMQESILTLQDYLIKYNITS